MDGMVVKQSRKELEWRQRLARFATSAQQIKPFCQTELVSEATFYRWRKKLADAGTCPGASAQKSTRYPYFYHQAGRQAWTDRCLLQARLPTLVQTTRSKSIAFSSGRSSPAQHHSRSHRWGELCTHQSDQWASETWFNCLLIQRICRPYCKVKNQGIKKRPLESPRDGLDLPIQAV